MKVTFEFPKSAAIKGGDKKQTYKYTKQKTVILEHLKTNNDITAAKAAEILNLKPTRTKEILSKTVAENLLICKGANRNRIYFINNS